MSGKKVILVDGTAAAYRAFYAIRDLSTADGRPTNAVFGFIRMLKQLEALWAPTHVGVVFDGGLPAERMALLAEYKQQRPKMPEALRLQLPLIQDYLGRAGRWWLRLEGEEADDVLATLAACLAGGESEILLASSDKDLYQLVRDGVSLVPLSGRKEKLDAGGVRDRTGVWPRQVVDWLSLVGDTADNIGGVPGIGAKTAARLLNAFGTLDRLLDEIGSLDTARLRDALQGSRERVLRNRKMIRLREDLPCVAQWSDLVVRDADTDLVLALLEELEFASMARALRAGRSTGADLFGAR